MVGVSVEAAADIAGVAAGNAITATGKGDAKTAAMAACEAIAACGGSFEQVATGAAKVAALNGASPELLAEVAGAAAAWSSTRCTSGWDSSPAGRKTGNPRGAPETAKSLVASHRSSFSPTSVQTLS